MVDAYINYIYPLSTILIGNPRVRKKSTIRNGREGKEKKRRKKKRKGKETRTKAQHNLCTTTLIKDGIIS